MLRAVERRFGRLRRWGVAMAVVLPCLGHERLSAAERATLEVALTARHGAVQDAPPPPGKTQSAQVPPVAPPNDAATTSQGADVGPAFKPLAGIDLDIRPPGSLFPTDNAVPYFQRAGGDPGVGGQGIGGRGWPVREFTWAAPDFCHRPLYFEEVYLERYGHSFGVVQPAVSSAQFFGRSLALPCLVVVRRPWECVYPLGHERPGDYVPFAPFGLGAR